MNVMLLCLFLAIGGLAIGQGWRRWRRQRLKLERTRTFKRRAKAKSLDAESTQTNTTGTRRKPDWVRLTVIGLGVHGLSCRQISRHFNRRFGRHITIGKSWVAEVLKAHALEIADNRRAMRRALPMACAVNHTWALDLCFCTTAQGTLCTLLGIIDHGSRRLLFLKHLSHKCTLTLLGHLFLTMARFGTPAAVRTDNEGMFKSGLWKAVFKALNIRHRRSAPYCPWHNGRIERLFGSLKPLLKKVKPASVKSLRRTLQQFQWLYNHVRVHQNLKGLTPHEVWQGMTLAQVQQEQAAQPGQWVSALDGLLIGYHARC